MFGKILSAFKIPEVRKRILLTLGLIFLSRVLVHIPAPGVNASALKELFRTSTVLGLLNIFSGGGMENFSLATLGLNPYINASIVMQLLTKVFPKLEELSKEGQQGYEQINTYTRYLTIPLSLVQAVGMYFLFMRQGVIAKLTPLALIVLAISLCAGTIVLMWLGELISEYGVGNGISVLIFAGIVSRLPISFGRTFVSSLSGNFLTFLAILGLFLVVIAAVTIVDEAERRVPIKYARRFRGGNEAGGGESNLPLKINQAGVIPVFFAVSLMLIPGMVVGYLKGASNGKLAEVAGNLANLLDPRSVFYNLVYFALVVAFTYFYTAVTFNPEEIADQVKNHGGFVPGVRPGRATSHYLNYIITRITLAGALFLGVIAVLPSIVEGATGIGTLTIGGTSILILVSVVLETMKKIESMMVTRDYEGFLE